MSDEREMVGEEPLHAVAAFSQTENARRGTATALGQSPAERTGTDGVRL